MICKYIRNNTCFSDDFFAVRYHSYQMTFKKERHETRLPFLRFANVFTQRKKNYFSGSVMSFDNLRQRRA